MLEKCFPIFSSSFSLWQFSKVTWDFLWQIDDHNWGKVTQWADGEVGGWLYNAGDPKSMGPAESAAALERAQSGAGRGSPSTPRSFPGQSWEHLSESACCGFWSQKPRGEGGELEGHRRTAQSGAYSRRIREVTGFCQRQKSFATKGRNLRVALGALCGLFISPMGTSHFMENALTVNVWCHLFSKKDDLSWLNSHCLERNTRLSYPGIQNNRGPWRNFPPLFLFISAISTSHIKEKSNSVEVK